MLQFSSWNNFKHFFQFFFQLGHLPKILSYFCSMRCSGPSGNFVRFSLPFSVTTSKSCSLGRKTKRNIFFLIFETYVLRKQYHITINHIPTTTVIMIWCVAGIPLFMKWPQWPTAYEFLKYWENSYPFSCIGKISWKTLYKHW